MDASATMAVSHRSDDDDGAQVMPSTRHRRRRPSLWDMRTPPYMSSLSLASPNPTSSQTPGLVAHAGLAMRSTEYNILHVPGPNDIVRPPAPGETGPLAGIDTSALVLLLRGKAAIRHGGGVSSGANIPHTSIAAAPPAPAIQAASLQHASGAQLSDATMQTTRHARRLYVGNLPADTTEMQIGDFFNRALVASKGSESGDEPVISVYINLDKRFAFIETRTVREAIAGLCLDGVKFRSLFLRVRRPNDYVPQGIASVSPPEGFNPAVLGIVSTQVSDGPNKMFIGGIPYTLTEDQVKGLLQSYGELAAFNLIKEPTSGMSKGFAFFEYVDNSVVDEACEGLHGMPVGDKTLTVRRATQSNSSGATHASGLARPNGDGSEILVKVSELMQNSTRVIQLIDIADRDELCDNAVFSDICQDIEEEAAKFGKVEGVVINRPSDKPSSAVAIGHAFIKFVELEDAESAQICLDGRKFGSRVVSARFFDEQRFESHHFSLEE